jgi:hypothetical protein
VLEDETVLIDDGDLNLDAEVEGNLHKKFKEFNASVDMKNPEFKMGMVFSDIKEIRKALQAYSIRNRVTIYKITAVCLVS